MWAQRKNMKVLIFSRVWTAFLVAVAVGIAAPGVANAQQTARTDSAGAATTEGIGPAVLAVVSLRHQRVSVYDAQGRAVRAGVSSGQTDYETPVGVYSILQKNREHYSNLYDDASMPFMQRLTWSGIALHGGALPGYPASHGCVRLPHGYAGQIFDQTKLGMRVIVARDDRAPVPISHALLFQPTIGPGVPAARQATPIAYEPNAAEKTSPFEADLTNWPERRAQLDAMRPAASEKAAEAERAKAHADEVKKVEKAKDAALKKLVKPLARAERAKARADAYAAREAKRFADATGEKSKLSEKAKKAAEQRSAKASKSATEAESALAAIKEKHQAAEAELVAARADLTAADSAKTTAVDAAKAARGKMLPVSVFVSVKTQRAYVRQGHEAMFDIPITVTDPATPIGTYVYTAVDYADGGNKVRWVATSLPPRAEDDHGAFDRGRRAANTEPAPPTDAVAAGAVLDRIVFPPEFVARVSEYVWPTSSLIVSDEEISKETGEATDFVVLISGEPQGGIKKRPRQPPPDYYYGYESYYDDDYYYERRPRRRQRYSPFFSFW